MDPCSNLYCGEKSFSEPELSGIGYFLESKKENLVGFMTIHAYSQLWMTPFGFTREKPIFYEHLVGF